MRRHILRRGPCIRERSKFKRKAAVSYDTVPSLANGDGGSNPSSAPDMPAPPSTLGPGPGPGPGVPHNVPTPIMEVPDTEDKAVHHLRLRDKIPSRPHPPPATIPSNPCNQRPDRDDLRTKHVASAHRHANTPSYNPSSAGTGAGLPLRSKPTQCLLDPRLSSQSLLPHSMSRAASVVYQAPMQLPNHYYRHRPRAHFPHQHTSSPNKALSQNDSPSELSPFARFIKTLLLSGTVIS